MKQRLRVMDRPGPDTGWPDRVYAISTSLCTPTSLAQPGAYGLGNSGGPKDG
jgi:hypothetical protein